MPSGGPFARRTMTVNGHEVVLDIDMDLQIGALSGDMDKVAAQMGFWGSVWAAAIREHEDADAHYRHWRARQVNAILESEPKLAEYKVNARINAMDGFLKLKSAQALASEHVAMARTMFDSLDKKSNQLQSKGAMSRSEIDATGMHTKGTQNAPPTKRGKRKRPKKIDAVDDDGDPRASAMKSLFQK